MILHDSLDTNNVFMVGEGLQLWELSNSDFVSIGEQLSLKKDQLELH